MITSAERLIAEIRSSPQFVEAASADRVWQDHLDALELGLEEIAAMTDADAIEYLDAIAAAMLWIDR